MIKVIKHKNTVNVYKCKKCDCIFIADEQDTLMDGIYFLLNCPECGYYISEDDIIDDQKINQQTINVPSCWKAREHDKKYKAINTSATTDDCIKRQ